MGSREIIEELNRIEKNYPVYSWEVGNIKIWPYLRFKLASKLFSAGKINKKGKLNHLYSRFVKPHFRFIKSSLLDSSKNERIEECDYLFWDNGIHSVNYNNKVYEIRSDPLIEKFEEKGYLVKKILIGNQFRIPRYHKSLFIQPILDLISFRHFIFKSEKSNIRGFELRKYDEFYKNLSNIIKDKKSLSKEVLLDNVSLINEYKRYFRRLLLRLKPKALFMVCYYSTPGFAMIKACKELNIPVIDIQHGIQGDHHYAYGSWEKYDLEGSESLLPDIFYLWSKDEAESIGKWKNNDIRVFIGGNDYLDMWRYGDINEISENIERLQEKYDLEKYKKIILYTLSGFDVVNQSIIEAINKSPKDWFWFIRMHPKRTDLIPFWREELKECNCDYAIKDIEKEPLYLLMKLSDIHLTERSSTVMEAEKFGLHSIVTEEESKGLFKQYIDSGNTVFANTPDQIKRYIVELDKEVLSIEDTREEKVDELINIIELTGK